MQRDSRESILEEGEGYVLALVKGVTHGVKAQINFLMTKLNSIFLFDPIFSERVRYPKAEYSLEIQLPH